jgi:toxin ParE1/3/4
MKVKWLNTALLNLDSAATYLYERNPNSAEVFIREVKSLTEYLTEQPSLGRKGRVSGTRELILTNFPYIIPYRIKDDHVEILRVFSTKMKLPKKW